MTTLKDMKDAIIGKPILIFLEKKHLGSRWAVGIIGEQVSIIGGLISFDAPKPLGWIDLPEDPEGL